ncbi:hypothetical protein SAMN05444414_10251 [Roseovarius marisflavi]|uniref:Excalibur calcium-binding domain-containing protein n=1 Tax=Roseovarius marisflavi TaxID=1054996 RepID=A0A1M6W103_9RHOB|nr:hypothetical protein [Roseovarius marisflavi]SHK87461.1 hypothetical protein SAMN05444414_10251 [Roseovarius marisflavi]
MRLILGSVALAALTACAPAVPDSGAGVGFQDYSQYQREKAARDAALAGNALPAPNAVSSEPLGAIPPGATSAQPGADVAADARAALEATAANSGQPILQASPSNPAPEGVMNSAGISRENSFEAVGEQRSIEDDASRIAQNRAQYQVVAPEAVGNRPGDVGPNIVAYALATKHPVGTLVYRRVGLNKTGKFERNCAEYASPDLAQVEFLKRGGPERDRLGLDPDGDGYACGWNPVPFRKAVGR